jgi:hypothetical protein
MLLNSDNFPANFFVVAINFFVSLFVSFYFFCPIFFSCRWQTAVPFASRAKNKNLQK